MSFNITVEGGTSVRLPTAGKYCDRDIIVTAEGGGVELDVVTASTLPTTVTDGQIVVITDTTPGTVYIDTDEPASPATGDVWVKLEAEATVKLELTEESPYLRGGLTAAAQWDGSTWVSRDGYLGVDGVWEKIAISLPSIGTALNDCTWEQISKIAASGKARDYFSIGDAKEIIINGTVGNTTFDNLSVWAFILDYDFNPTYEETNTIHFQIAKTAKTGGTDICLTDSKYNAAAPTGEGYFNMNYTNTNSGGWESSKMRTVLLGSPYNPVSPLEGSFLAALPLDLRMVMKGCTKYTDNVAAGSNAASDVTATIDYLWFLSEWELYGAITNANPEEKNYQKQYAYYAAGNSKVKYRQNAPSSAAVWFMRSAYSRYATSFCRVNTDGSANQGYANYCVGIAPCFCV